MARHDLDFHREVRRVLNAETRQRPVSLLGWGVMLGSGAGLWAMLLAWWR